MKDYVLKSPDIRQSKEWARYLERIKWITYQKNGVNIFVRRVPLIGSFIKIQHPKHTIPYQQIDQVAKKEKALAVILEPHNFGFKEKVFKINSYQESALRLAHTLTYRIDLKPTKKTLFKSFSENARRNIRKSQNNNLVIKKIPLKNLTKTQLNQTFEEFFKLLENLSKEKRFYIEPRWQWRKKIDAFKETSTLLFAYKDNQAIAAVWLAKFKKSLFYLHTGINKEGYKNLANYLLVWEGFLLGKKLGCVVFDFEASFDPRYPKEHPSWRSFTEFKERFHGEIIEFPPSQIKFYSRIFKVFYLCTKVFSR